MGPPSPERECCGILGRKVTRMSWSWYIDTTLAPPEVVRVDPEDPTT